MAPLCCGRSKGLDHVLLSQKLQASCTWSVVLEDLDISGGHHDHHAAAAHCQWYDTLATPSSSSVPAAFDRAHIGTSQELPSLLGNLRPRPWSTDIESEIHWFNQQVHNCLQLTCKKPKYRPKKPYISDLAWQRRMSCSRIASALRYIGLAYMQYRQTLSCYRVKLCAQLSLQRRELKKQLRTDKQSGLQTVLKEFAEETPASQVLVKLRLFIGPSNAKKFFEQPLPIIRNEDGIVCTSPEEALDAWTNFFSRMEGGARMDPIPITGPQH